MTKPFYTYDQQINKLKSKHMIINDEDNAKDILHRYGYYALVSGYKEPLKNRMNRDYQDGTSFDDIVALYRFDEQLRGLTLQYLLHIERHIRSLISYCFCARYGESQSEYLDRGNYDISPNKRRDVDKLIRDYLLPLTRTGSGHRYIEYNVTHYHNVPLWVSVNALTFGTLSKMYELSKSTIQSAICHEFMGINETEPKQLLEVLTDFRNVCAHSERLFIHQCARHDIPDLLIHQKLHIPQIGTQYIYGKRDYFAVVISFLYLLSHEDFLKFKAALTKLICKVTTDCKITETDLLVKMGMPSNWKKISSYKKY